jgi:aminopeptidase-like protein
MVDVSINKAIWTSCGGSETILEGSVDSWPMTWCSTQEARLEAIQAAKKGCSIEIINMARGTRKFRQIAQQEWKVWAARTR